jgi:hypothetical protein
MPSNELHPTRRPRITADMMPSQRSATLRLLPVAIAAAMLTLSASGCGSESATATGSSTANPGESNVDADQAAATPPATSRPKPRPGAKTKVLERVGDRSFDKTFDDLRFEMEPGEPFRREMLTDEIEDLAGKHIRIRGYILPTAQQRGIKQFVLVRDNQECCFGQGAALFDCILVEMVEGKTAAFSIRPVAVAGTFDVREFIGPDERHLAIYHLDAELVE